MIFRAEQHKQRTAQSPRMMRARVLWYYWTIPLAAVGERANSRPRIKAPQLCDTDDLDRTTHAPNRTPSAPFSQPPRPRGASRASQQQRYETRGLLFLIAA